MITRSEPSVQCATEKRFVGMTLVQRWSRVTPKRLSIKVAASGGYMMACVGDKILAAPFAIIGSIGVVAQMPNFNRFLKKHNVDFELLTAGEHKRTLTMFGKNTETQSELTHAIVYWARTWGQTGI